MQTGTVDPATARTEATRAEAQDFSPSERARRGRALAARAESDWPAIYDGADSRSQVAYEALHAALEEVPGAQLPAALGQLLGRLAADAIVDRGTEARHLVGDHEVVALIDALGAAVAERHWG